MSLWGSVESNLDTVGSARCAGVTGGCGRMEPFSWLCSFVVQKEKRQIVVSLSPELISLNLPPSTCGERWICKPQRPLQFDRNWMKKMSDE